MTPQESTLISSLFDRLEQTPAQQHDPEAERLIQSRVASNSNATYLLTQSTLVLQQALTAAQSKIAAMEKQIETPAPQGGFLSGITNLFDIPQTPTPSNRIPTAPPPIPQQTPAPQGGGFLKGALATAAGVAGGALLFQGIENLLGHNPGPFGGIGLPSGGFLGSNQAPEIVNNYYGDSFEEDGGHHDFPDQNNLVENSDDFGSFGQDDVFSDSSDDSSFV